VEPTKEPLIHPPWRTMAEEILRATDPSRHSQLRADGLLESHLDDLAEQARSTYDVLVPDLMQKQPGAISWAMSAAQEMIVRDILDPTT
jgi:hypothetical protein